MKKFFYLISIASVPLLLFFILHQLQSSKVCANNCKESFQLQIENNSSAFFNQKNMKVPQILPESQETDVFGSETLSGEKHIKVNLTTQTLTVYQGKKILLKTLISSGLWGRTPVGTFIVWSKLRATRMTGGEGADYYDLPNVPYVMFYSNNEVPAMAGFSLHGTYWHNNFGHPMSHGCINMKTSDVAKLYDWANPVSDGLTTYSSDKNLGTKVTIYGEAPL